MKRWALVLVAACNPYLGMDPIVMLDQRMSNEQAIAGLHAWDEAGVTPDVIIVPHDDLVRVPRASNVMLAIAVEHMTDCPLDDLMGGAAQTDTFADGSAVTCFDLSQIEAGPDNEVKRAAAHEFGHALGLSHLPEPDSVMAARFAGSDTPTCSDFAHLASERLTRIPGRCKN